METGDEWWAPDKFYHVIFCFSITVMVSLLATQTRYPFLRRRSIWVGSVASLAAGAAKEAADELGFFKSAGASPRDAVADLLGILVAVVALSLSKSLPFRSRPDRPGKDPGFEMV